MSNFTGLKRDHHLLKDKWVTCYKCNENILENQKMICKHGNGKTKKYHKSCFDKLFH